MNRRDWIRGLVASLPLSFLGLRAAAPGDASPSTSPPQSAVAIASANGLEAVARAYELAQSGTDPLDAAIAGVNIVELDPNDYTVGYGGIPNADGVVQLDSAVMHGPRAKGGAVAALEGVKTPSRVAKLVMNRTDHVLLVGVGARRFATLHGFPNEDLLTDLSRKVYLYWKENISAVDDWVEPPLEELDPEVREFIRKEHDAFRPGGTSGGTIHLSVLSPTGNLACCTTTCGLFFKIPGRVGDSPLIGAGLYCDNDVGSCGATGRGEAAILSNASHTAVEFMRQGLAPEAALLKTLERVVDLNRDPRLKQRDGRPDFNLRLYGVNKKGQYGSVAIWKQKGFAVADARGARLEEGAYLYTGRY